MHSKRNRRITPMVLGVCLLLALFACVISFAQDKPQAAPKSTKKSDIVNGNADIVKSKFGSNTQVLMKGHVKFVHDDTVLMSDQVTYDKQAKSAESPGRVTIVNSDCEITGEKGAANFGKRLGVIEGNVMMLMKPKKSEEPQDKESVRAKFNEQTMITCPKLEYQYKAKIATATGGVHFAQPKRSATAQKAVYDQNKEILTLTGDVKGTDEDGQTFAAPTVRISLKKGDEWLEAENASTSFKIDLGEDNKTDSSK